MFLQVKFSELTLDMFRMLQVLEREPEDAPSRTLVTSTEVSEGQDNQVCYNLNTYFVSGRLLHMNLVCTWPG